MIKISKNFNFIKEPLDVFNICQMHFIDDFNWTGGISDKRLNLSYLAKCADT